MNMLGERDGQRDVLREQCDAQRAAGIEQCDAQRAVGIEQREQRPLRDTLGDVLVLGAGASGQAVVRYCTALMGTRVRSIFVAAGRDTPSARAFLERYECDDFAYAFGDEAVPSERHFDLCIASPGIPVWHRLYQEGKRASTQLIGEFEFAWRESDPASVWIAITGTNGKTTTTALCAHLLRESGFRARAVGNIGDTCLDGVMQGGTQVYVAEVSSYQLASTCDFAPDVAVILNITPDHLHWHGTFEVYRDAKLSLLERMGARSRECLHEQAKMDAGANEDSPNAKHLPVAVLGAVDEVVRSKVRTLRQLSVEEAGFDYIPLGTSVGIRGDMRAACGARNAAFVDANNRLIVAYDGKTYDVGSADDLQLLGEHNITNALAAASAALLVGADVSSVARSLASFKPLEHRIEPCGEIEGVLCINDSKATNVDSTLAALEACSGRRVVVLLGGEDKGTDLTPLVQAVRTHAVAAVCFGEAAPRFLEVFAQSTPTATLDGFTLLEAAHLADAFEVAMSFARAGDVVLLSPACASFDEFANFEERGRAFKELVCARMTACAKTIAHSRKDAPDNARASSEGQV